MPSNAPPDTFDVTQAKAICDDLFKPNPVIYWIDLLISLTIAYSCAGVYFLSEPFSALQIGCMIVAAFALHRVANFMHELAHFRKYKSMRSFYYGWNILAGVPMLIPSYFFENHLAHHTKEHFGTGNDCEYLPLGRGPFREMAYFFGQIFLQPILVLIRFVILTPISFLIPSFREWTLRYFSKFVFDFKCDHQLPKDSPRRWWATIDTLCWLRASAIFVTVIVGLNPWFRPLQIYALALLTLFLHYFRSLGAHHYLSEGKRLPFEDQLLDSINIKGMPILTELLFPVGLRYHALHHLFPAMPYHCLPEAHRRLMKQLPAGSLYRQLEYPSFWSVLKILIRNAWQRQTERVHYQKAA